MVGLAALPAAAQTATSLDARVQAPTLAAPERGSLAGQLASTAFGPADVSRGGFQLPSALGLPAERGAPLASILPTYSPDQGWSEWGLGWQSALALTRWRVTGDLDYATDELTGPWGRMVQGQDGDWYPLGLSSAVRLHAEPTGAWTAWLPDGSRWTFGSTHRVDTPKGTYAWYLEEVVTALGRKMKLEYDVNASGRRFMKAAHYGGIGDDFQYRADFVHELLARPGTDLRSGEALVLDRRVKDVIAFARNSSTGLFEERWRETLTYVDDAPGPAFHLTEVQRTYASGQQPPPVRYGYSLPGEQLDATALRRTPKLDAVLSQWGGDATQPHRAAVLDVNLDGRPDFEHHHDNTLLVQEDAGFASEPLPPASATVSPACRRAPGALNEPRLLAQLRASEDAFQVVALRANTPRTQTTFTACDRAGEPFSSQTLTGDWTASSNVRLVDVNRDRQPDLVRVSAGRVTILPNTSDASGFSFGAAKVVTLAPVFTPNTSWVHDVNGDGVADIVSRGTGGSVSVWLGRGQFAFETQARNFQFRGTTGIPVSSLGDSQLTFLDANRDGLADALLTRTSGTGAYLYLNTGTGFSQVTVPALQAMTSTLGRPVVGDFAGTGDTEVGYVLSGEAYSLALDAPQTSLMRSADDGKGTVLRFEYARGPATPGVLQRQSLLAALQVESSGYDTVRYTYDYEQPTLHSVGRFLVGFGGVTRTAPGMVSAANFLNGDGFAGLPSSATQHDILSPGLNTYEYQQYEDALFRGIAWKRLKVQGTGWSQSDGQAVGARTEYTAYEAELCPSRVVNHSPHGTLTTETWRASVPGLAGHLHCLNAGTRLMGSHADSTLDFQNEVRIQRNAVGLITRVEDVAASGDVLPMQEVAYRPDFLIDHITLPGKGTAYFDWEPGSTSQLWRVRSPDGLVLEATARHPGTGAVTALTTRRGSRSFTRFSRLDGQERLVKQWDDLEGASEALPNVQLAYQYATGTRPGRITTTGLVDALAGAFATRVEWQTAAGEGIASAALIPDGWRVEGLTTRSRNLLQTKQYVRAPLGVSTDVTSVDYGDLLLGANVVGTLNTTGLGFESDALNYLHANVSQHVATRLSVQDGLLKQEAVENGTHTTRRFMDADKRLVAYEDEAGTRYTYGYDALGRLRAVLMPGGKGHRVFFDSHGRVSRVVRDDVAQVAFTYEPGTGFLASKSFLSPAGQPVRREDFTYDSQGRQTHVLHTEVATSATRSYRFYYDGATPSSGVIAEDAGLLTAVQGEGFLKLFMYRVDGKLLRKTLKLKDWRVVEQVLTYREDGSVRQEESWLREGDGTLLSHNVLANASDVHGRTATIHLDGALLADLQYSSDGELGAAQLASGSWVTFSRDSLTRAPVGFSQAAPGLMTATSWRFNARSLLESETMSVGTVTLARTHGYSAQRFLTSSTDAQHTYAYEYDVEGLPGRIEENGASRTLTRQGNTLTAGSTVYTFDDLGRTVSMGDLSLAYGPDGHLAQATRGTDTWEFLYDEVGQRLLKLKDGVPLAAYLEGGSWLDDSGLTRPFKVGGQLVGVTRGSTFTPLAADLRGTVLSDDDGTPRFASPYGTRTTRPSSSAAIDYVEKGYDADLGLIRMGVRDYDASLGRFTTPDPYFLEAPQKCVDSPVECSLYGYSRSAPTLYADPSGRAAVLIPVVLFFLLVPMTDQEAFETAGEMLASAAMPMVMTGYYVGKAAAELEERKYTQAGLSLFGAATVGFGPAILKRLGIARAARAAARAEAAAASEEVKDTLAIVNAQPGDDVVERSVKALAKERPDKVVEIGDVGILANEQRLTVVGHGDKAGLVGDMTAKELATKLKVGGYKGGTVELIACNTGCNGYAQKLANELGIPVRAPMGRTSVTDGLPGVPQVVSPTTGKLMEASKGWEYFFPEKPWWKFF